MDGRIPLFVNMDETSVAYSFAKTLGLIISKRALPRGKKLRKQQVSSSDEKAHISFLAFLTNISEVQPKLPQVFLGNEHKFTLKLMRTGSPHPWEFSFYQGRIQLELPCYDEESDVPPS